MKIALSQINTTVGDIWGNTAKIKEHCLKNPGSDICVFPELAVCGYPVEDLVNNPDLLASSSEALNDLVNFSKGLDSMLLIGLPIHEGGKTYNAAYAIHKGKILARAFKQALPNYSVFDEKRNFSAGDTNTIIEFKDKKIGIAICEDLWDAQPVNGFAVAGLDILLSLNASPFEAEKQYSRLNVIKNVARRIKALTIYVNQVGGQDGIVFDGGSFVCDGEGAIVMQAPFWEAGSYTFEEGKNYQPPPDLSTEENIYQALMLGLKDYTYKNGFQKVCFGISGGIDSALVAAIACDALGPENVYGAMLPSRFTSQGSLQDADALAQNLGIALGNFPIEAAMKGFTEQLQYFIDTDQSGVATENLQARIRGTMLMLLSNATASMLLATGNKSEYAVGYGTIYGDMCGGYAPIKDIYKTQVYDLVRWRNSNIPNSSRLQKNKIIPDSIITKAPTAELKPGQTDQDTLPPYEILDRMLYMLVEEEASLAQVYNQGYDVGFIQDTIKRLQLSEFKRRQSPIGTKTSKKSFDKDRRYPITNKKSQH